MRWRVAAAVCLGMAVNYLDRQVLAVLAPQLRDAFEMTNAGYARAVFSFQLAYMVASLTGGRFVDRIGVRRGYAVMMVWWSAACLLHAFATGLAGLVVLRFLLGLGEGGTIPAGAKAIAEWFPPRERALGVGMLNASFAVAGVLAPPLTALVAVAFGWRAPFAAVAALGLLWLPVWLGSYREPDEHPASRPRESLSAGAAELFRFPQVWALAMARLVADSPWQFYMFWLPEYLKRERGMALAEIGMMAWLPFVFAGAGSAAGGWASGRLIRSGWGTVTARKAVMCAAAALMPSGILAALAPDGFRAVLWICLAAAGHSAWVSNAQTLPSDIVPSRWVGTLLGFTQTTAYIGNLAVTLVIGAVLDRFSYFPVFCAAGVLHPIATLILLAAFRDTGRVRDYFERPSRSRT